MRIGSMVAAGAIAGALLVPAGSAAAAYTPSCNSGVVAPQLCTLVTTIVASSFGPRETGYTGGHLRALASSDRIPGNCATPDVNFNTEEYVGTIDGTVRGFPVHGSLYTLLDRCLDTPSYIIGSSSAFRGIIPTGPRISPNHYRSWRSLIGNLSVAAHLTDQDIRFEMLWRISIQDCRWAGDFAYCQRVYDESTDWNGCSPSCGVHGTITLRNTGVRLDGTGTAYQRRWSSYDKSELTTKQVRYVEDGSISGHWARLGLGWSDQPPGSGDDAQATFAAAPEGRGWRVQVAGTPYSPTADQKVRDTLRDGATANESHFTDFSRYADPGPRGLDQLADQGWIPAPRVSMRVVVGGGEEYCLDASHALFPRRAWRIRSHGHEAYRPVHGAC